MIGQRFGPFEVIGQLGAGGMGEVYRARDTRLGREHGHLSPDGTSLALPLTDGETTNLWLVPVDGGPPRPVTDFGSRATLIVRWASWTPDGRHLVAAVAETDVDIVSFDGLL